MTISRIPEPSSPPQPPAGRSDRTRNRQRILAAARAAGPAAPVAAIARRAHIAPATVYRHFPTRHDLLDALHVDAAAGFARVFDDARLDPDPWRGLHRLVHRLVAARIAARGCTDTFVAAFPQALVDHERAVHESLDAAITAATAAGRLRAGVAVSDLTLLLTAVDGIPGSGPSAARDAQRLVGHVLRGLERDHRRDAREDRQVSSR